MKLFEFFVEINQFTLSIAFNFPLTIYYFVIESSDFRFSKKSMDTDGHLCYLCSEIFDEERELQEHLLDDHNIKWEAESDTDITDSIQRDLDEEVELYDPLPLIEDDDIEDEFLLDVTTKNGSTLKTSSPKPVSNPIQVHYNQIIQGQSQANSNNDPKKMRRRKQRTEQWYQCDKCLFKTKIKSVLKNHQLTHTFDCVFCPFKTVIPDALTAHIKGVHFGEPRVLGSWIQQPQQQPQQSFLEHQQPLQQPLEVGSDILQAESGYNFLLLDVENQTAVSQSENVQIINDTRFSYLNTPRQSVISNSQDSKLTQRAHTFLQSTVCSTTALTKSLK